MTSLTPAFNAVTQQLRQPNTRLSLLLHPNDASDAHYQRKAQIKLPPPAPARVGKHSARSFGREDGAASGRRAIDLAYNRYRADIGGLTALS